MKFYSPGGRSPTVGRADFRPAYAHSATKESNAIEPDARRLRNSHFARFAQLLNDLHLKFAEALILCIPFVPEFFKNGFMLRGRGGWFHISSCQSFRDFNCPNCGNQAVELSTENAQLVEHLGKPSPIKTARGLARASRKPITCPPNSNLFRR